MEVRSWPCNSGNFNDMDTLYYSNTRRYDRINVSFNVLVNREPKSSSAPIWRSLWRKIMREKKRLFDCSSSSADRMHFSYDAYNYSQNFDQGSSMWSDPDNVSRSFSARFAVPARIFEKSTAMVDY
ncbi:uncharacterized protein LOC126681432 [Mercurialis annua]|uniref:uncharacterized protein LOC126681432 n=1 Tax=Mercurialis annua TaxID=3986 RepID=UPI00215F7468|nr:uncharacterized protein LOC126681432 [Mercurialis annua]